jgi:hypothetical protein
MNTSGSGKTWTLYRIGTWGALGILIYFLLTEHQAHVIQFLPYIILLACPLMHIFMHKGHGHHGANSDHSDHKEIK